MQQVHQYQEENKRDHDRLFNKIDSISDKVNQLSSDQRINEKRFDNLEAGQKEINATVNDIDKRVKSLEERDKNWKHTTNFALKALGVAATIGAIVGIILKFIGFF